TCHTPRRVAAVACAADLSPPAWPLGRWRRRAPLRSPPPHTSYAPALCRPSSKARIAPCAPPANTWPADPSQYSVARCKSDLLWSALPCRCPAARVVPAPLQTAPTPLEQPPAASPAFPTLRGSVPDACLRLPC